MPKKDNVSLLCDITELAGLFDFDVGINAFLQKVVSMVAWHMKAAVCSIYLLDPDTQELVLTANQGLNQDYIGKLRLKIGEGIVGASLRDMKGIREANGRNNPDFKFIYGSGEEGYNSFLAVPITRKLERIGVLAAQDPQEDYFTENDEKALKVISGQLAGVIEYARLLWNIHTHANDDEPDACPVAAGELCEGSHLIRGVGASSGLSMGLTTRIGDYLHADAAEESLHTNLTEADFDRSLALTEEQLASLQKRLENTIQDAAATIFSAHILMLKDETFSGEIRRLIHEGANPWSAVLQEVRKYADIFSKSSNPSLREKVLDIEDLGHRILHNLDPKKNTADGPDYTGQIVIAEDVLPSDVLKLATEGAAGLVVLGGGQNSHVSILSKALLLPLLIVNDSRLLHLPEKTPAILDASNGNLVLRPTEETIEKFKESLEAIETLDSLAERAKERTFTPDGRRIHLYANLNLLSELGIAEKLKAEGVGLYRTEFPFIVRSTFPSEEEQVVVYQRVLEQMKDKPITFRTLDIGGDKALSYYPSPHENNPFLGLRALRFSLRNPEIFKQQLRALLRAAHGHEKVRIMFPLVASVDEFLAARNMAALCHEELDKEGIPNRLPQLGIMVELPSAIELIEDLAQVVDFMSIGSNDLIQYLLAVDRTNDEVASLYSAYHPAVLRALNRVVQSALKAGKSVSLCGNMATDPKMLPFLLGIGLDCFSMDAMQIPGVQKMIEAWPYEKAKETAAAMLKISTIEDVAAYLETLPLR